MVEIKMYTATIAREHLKDLIGLFRRNDYCVAGPIIRNNVIVYDEVAGVDDLPAGWTGHRDGGSYRFDPVE